MPIQSKPKPLTFSTTSSTSPPERTWTYNPLSHAQTHRSASKGLNPSIRMQITQQKWLFCQKNKTEKNKTNKNLREIHSLKLQQMAALQKEGTAWGGHRLATTAQAVLTPSCTYRSLSEALHSSSRHFAGNPLDLMDNLGAVGWQSGWNPFPLPLALSPTHPTGTPVILWQGLGS